VRDLYGRSSSWHIQGTLPEQEPSGGARCADRIRAGFERRPGPGLPLSLIIGIASFEPDGDMSAAFPAAERAIHRDRRPGAVPATALPASEPRGRAEFARRPRQPARDQAAARGRPDQR
jgi:hypothetical protein